jgi:hypothetical protein
MMLHRKHGMPDLSALWCFVIAERTARVHEQSIGLKRFGEDLMTLQQVSMLGYLTHMHTVWLITAA